MYLLVEVRDGLDAREHNAAWAAIMRVPGVVRALWLYDRTEADVERLFDNVAREARVKLKR